MDDFESITWLNFYPKKTLSLNSMEVIVKQGNCCMHSLPNVKNESQGLVSIDLCGPHVRSLKLRKGSETSFLVSPLDISTNDYGIPVIQTTTDVTLLVVNGKLAKYHNQASIHELARFSCEKVFIKKRDELQKKKSKLAIYRITNSTSNSSSRNVNNPTSESTSKPSIRGRGLVSKSTASNSKEEKSSDTSKPVKLVVQTRDLSNLLARKPCQVYVVVPPKWVEEAFEKSYSDIKKVTDLGDWVDYVERDIYAFQKLFFHRKSFYSHAFSNLLDQLISKQNRLICENDVYKDLMQLYHSILRVVDIDTRDFEGGSVVMEEDMKNSTGQEILLEWSNRLIRLERKFNYFVHSQRQKIMKFDSSHSKHVSLEDRYSGKQSSFLADFMSIIDQHIQLMKEFISQIQIVFNHYIKEPITDSATLNRVFREWAKSNESDIPQDKMFNYLIASLSEADHQISKYFTGLNSRIDSFSGLHDESNGMESMQVLGRMVSRVRKLTKLQYSQCAAAKNFLQLIIFHYHKKNTHVLQEIIETVEKQQESLIQSFNFMGPECMSYFGFSFSFIEYKIAIYITKNWMESMKAPQVSENDSKAKNDSEKVRGREEVDQKKSLSGHQRHKATENTGEKKSKVDIFASGEERYFNTEWLFKDFISEPSISDNRKRHFDKYLSTSEFMDSTLGSLDLLASPGSQLDARSKSWTPKVFRYKALVEETIEVKDPASEKSDKSKITKVDLQFVKSLNDIEKIRVEIPSYSSMSTSGKKILPLLAQTIHNFLEYAHCLLYNLNGFEPGLSWIVRDSGQVLLWTVQELRAENPRKCLSEYWEKVLYAVISSNEMKRYSQPSLRPQNFHFVKRICSTSKNQPLEDMIKLQIIPLLICALRHEYLNLDSTDSKNTKNVNNTSNFIFDSHHEQPISLLWVNVASSCKWVKDMLTSMRFFEVMKEMDVENMSLFEDNQLTSEVLVQALNDKGLANLFVEYARTAKNMSFYGDGSILKSREKLQKLVDLLSILDEYPWNVTISFIHEDS